MNILTYINDAHENLYCLISKCDGVFLFMVLQRPMLILMLYLLLLLRRIFSTSRHLSINGDSFNKDHQKDLTTIIQGVLVFNK